VNAYVSLKSPTLIHSNCLVVVTVFTTVFIPVIKTVTTTIHLECVKVGDFKPIYAFTKFLQLFCLVDYNFGVRLTV
jgi:hypothetical protein